MALTISLEKAVAALEKKYPNAKPKGYFIKENAYVFNTAGEDSGIIENSFFEVNNNGEVRVTNPIIAKIWDKTITPMP